jgi:sugar (pentulose or hexulose) kinase
VGVTGMLPALVLLDKDGHVLRPSIQQSDGRCAREVEELRREWEESDFLARAGNGINQQLVTAKLRWIARHEPDVFRRIATVFGSYDFINWKLTGRRAIERNWALEAGFVDVRSDALDDELIALARISRDAIPPKMMSHHILGGVTAEAAAQTGLAEGTPVIGGAADMIASAFAAGINRRGDVLLSLAERSTSSPRRTLRVPIRDSFSTITSCPASICRTAAWRREAPGSTGSPRHSPAARRPPPSVRVSRFTASLTVSPRDMLRAQTGSRSCPTSSARRRRYRTRAPVA